MIGNLVRLALMFVINIFLARALGPSTFGDYNFLLNSFLGIRALMDLGTGSAMLTFLSKKKRGRSFYVHYGSWLVLQLVTALTLIYFLPDTMRDRFWLNQPFHLVLAACITSFLMNQIWETTTNIGEAIRDTFRIQIRNILVGSIFLLSLFVLNMYGALSIFTALVAASLCYGVMASLYFLLVYPLALDRQTKETFTNLNSQYFNFCPPLALIGIVSFIYVFTENWMLNNFAGSIEQGYFSIGYKFSTVALLATNAILKVFWKEVAEAQENGLDERISHLYLRTCRFLYSSAAFVGCFGLVYAKDLIRQFLGPTYSNAVMPFSILLLIPMHQALGQLVNAYLQASGQVKSLRNISILGMLFSLPACYLALAPESFFVPGFNGGAAGYALKIFITQLFTVNLFLFVASKKGVPFFSWLEQIFITLILICCAFLAKYLGSMLLLSFESVGFMVEFVCGGILYIILSLIMAFSFPERLGFDSNWFGLKNRGRS